jgi:hypothetical protein
MKAVTYTFRDRPKFDAFSEPLAWRFGYLIADTITATCCHISFTVLEGHQLMTGTQNKLYALKHECNYAGEDGKKLFEDLTKHYEERVKKKNKIKSDFVFLNKLDMITAKLYKDHLKNLEMMFAHVGIGNIRDLIDDVTFCVNEFNPNNAEDTSHNNMGASDVMLRIGKPQEQEPEIMIMFPDFFKEEWPVCSATDTMAEVTTHGYLQKCFEIPFLQHMKNEELSMVRKELKEPLAQFRTTMDNWITYATTNEEGSLNYFRQEVLPIAEKVDEAICANELLTYNKQIYNEKMQFEVWIGELPVTTIWEHNKNMGAISPATWEVLQKAKAQDPVYSRRFPVIALKNKFLGQTTAAEEVQMYMTKKSILID